jgi:hypothetical protein
MPKINLSDIQSAANTKFADFEITLPGGEIIFFQPVLRLEKHRRLQLKAAMDLKARGEADADTDLYDLYQDAFKVVAKTPDAYDKLVAAVGDDPAVWQELFESYNEDTEPGEA